MKTGANKLTIQKGRKMKLLNVRGSIVTLRNMMTMIEFIIGTEHILATSMKIQ
jgi:hypothetical protein